VVVPEHDADGLLQLVGERDGKPVCLLAMRFIAPHLEAYELPPSPLALRVSDVAGDAFRLSGLKGFTDLWGHVGEHRRKDSRPLQVPRLGLRMRANPPVSGAGRRRASRM
jgi:hypothetical protein